MHTVIHLYDSNNVEQYIHVCGYLDCIYVVTLTGDSSESCAGQWNDLQNNISTVV